MPCDKLEELNLAKFLRVFKQSLIKAKLVCGIFYLSYSCKVDKLIKIILWNQVNNAFSIIYGKQNLLIFHCEIWLNVFRFMINFDDITLFEIRSVLVFNEHLSSLVRDFK